MLSRSKLYVKQEPDKDARLFIIFSEGERTEPNYFKYFNEVVSRIKIEMVPHKGYNSPLGLLETAESLLLPPEGLPKYDLNPADEVWFVIDTDKWGQAVAELRARVLVRPNWFIAQSNPCFEVWQYYHFSNHRPPPDWPTTPSGWKNQLSVQFGGFNCHKHPIHMEMAITNALHNYVGQPGQPGPADTEVYRLAA